MLDRLMQFLGWFSFLLWIPVVAVWIRKGMRTPKWVHLYAAAMFAVGLATLMWVRIDRPYLIDLKTVAVLLLGLPLGVYLFWLWLLPPLPPQSPH